jgi:hypothetical protein
LPLAPGNRDWAVLDCERVEAAEVSFLLKTLGIIKTIFDNK